MSKGKLGLCLDGMVYSIVGADKRKLTVVCGYCVWFCVIITPKIIVITQTPEITHREKRAGERERVSIVFMGNL